jgi:hypothetical protein
MGASITDRIAQVQGAHKTWWDQLKVHLTLNPYEGGTRLLSLLKVMVFLDDSPHGFVVGLSPMSLQHAKIVRQGQQIRALRPAYLEHQRASISNHSPLPTVLQSIVATYAEPTLEDMWTDWVQ